LQGIIVRQAVNAHCCWGVSGLGPAHGTSGVPQIGPGGGSACANPASPQKAAAIAKPSAASAKRRCLIMVSPFPPDGRGRYTGPATTRPGFCGSTSPVVVGCAALVVFPHRDRAFVAESAVRAGLWRVDRFAAPAAPRHVDHHESNAPGQYGRFHAAGRSKGTGRHA
jgi:hypothetical protein